MDFSSLTPLSAPGSVSEDTVIVGEQIPCDLGQALAGFSRAFEGADALPALVVTTSGSTGKPKQTVLSAGALKDSARTTAQVTDSDHGQWLLALPLHYVAGAQVAARSVYAGTTPVVMQSVSQKLAFSAEDFVETAHRLSSRQTMTSLVPTQLHTLLELDGRLGDEAVSALRSFQGVLLGGAPASASLLTACQELGINVMTTYGSAETAGGCVYSGKPLPGVVVELDDAGGIWLGGPTIALGYLGEDEKTAASFFSDTEGTRWYRTDDLGTFAKGRLKVQGRSDDVIITGGVKVSAHQVAVALEEHPAVREAHVAGVPDEHWGSAVAAGITVVSGTQVPSLESLKPIVEKQVGKAGVPKHLVVFENFPTLSTGKPHRQAITQSLLAGAQAEGVADPSKV